MLSWLVSEVSFLGCLIPAYARWCLPSLSSRCRSFACGDPGRLLGLNNARLLDAGVLVLWRDCMFLWVDAQDVISELFLVELILVGGCSRCHRRSQYYRVPALVITVTLSFAASDLEIGRSLLIAFIACCVCPCLD